MGNRRSLRKPNWPAVLLAAVGLLTVCSSCVSTRGPTPAEFPQIVAAIRERLATEHGVLGDAAPVDVRINRRDGHAVVTYSARYEHGQFASYPMKTELVPNSLADHTISAMPLMLETGTHSLENGMTFNPPAGAWTVVGHESNHSWMWNLANHTVGVK